VRDGGATSALPLGSRWRQVDGTPRSSPSRVAASPLSLRDCDLPPCPIEALWRPRGMAFSKLLIVGLDSAAPTLVFDRWRDELPTLASLIARGAHGRMVSTHPPITVPAWTSMMSSRDPGEEMTDRFATHYPFVEIGVAAVEHQRAGSLGMRGGEQHRHR